LLVVVAAPVHHTCTTNRALNDSGDASSSDIT
jgi:hypothetical protein